MEFECEADGHPVYATQPRQVFENRWFDYKAIDEASERASDFHKDTNGGAGGRPASWRCWYGWLLNEQDDFAEMRKNGGFADTRF